MPDDDKSMVVQVICNQRVLNYDKLRGMKPMCLSSLWSDYIVEHERSEERRAPR